MKLKQFKSSVIVISIFMIFNTICSFSQEKKSRWANDPQFMDWSFAGADTTVRQKFKKTYNVLKSGFKADGKTDNGEAFRKLLRRVKPYSIVYFPEGTYFFATSIDLPSNIIIRGDGPDKTKFNFHTLKLGQRGAFNMASYERLFKTNVKQEVKIGDQTIFVESTEGYKSGDILEIYMENDSALMYTRPKWNKPWASLARGQILEVTRVNKLEGSISVDQKIRINYPLEFKPQVLKQDGYTNIGFEDFAIENFQVEDMVTFYFREGRNCWLDNIYSKNTVKHHVLFEASSKSSVLNCYMTGSFRVDGGGHGYGVTCSNHTSDCLTENNIFSLLRHAVMTKKGANGNAFLHNYCVDGIWDKMKNGLAGPERRPATLSVHGHYSYMNLFEGNMVERITSADFWGPSGVGTTFIGNIISIDNIEIKDYSVGQNVFGNILETGVVKFHEGCKDVKQGLNILTKGYDPSLGFPDLTHHYQSKPHYFGDMPWPVNKHYEKDKVLLPAQKRYIEQYKNK